MQSPQVIDRWARGLAATGSCSLAAFSIALGGWPGVLLFALLLMFVYYVSMGKHPTWRGKLETGNLLWAVVGGGLTAVCGIALIEMALT
jgi:hypothetical protein